jgi:hypothetical protein
MILDFEPERHGDTEVILDFGFWIFGSANGGFTAEDAEIAEVLLVFYS